MKSNMFIIITVTTIGALTLSACSDNSTTADPKAESIATETQTSEKPLAEQPKAMVDKAQVQADKINQKNQDKLESIESMQ